MEMKLYMLKQYKFYFNYILLYLKSIDGLILIIIGDWGLGIGEWGLGVGAQNPNPKPQNPNPKPQKK